MKFTFRENVPKEEIETLMPEQKLLYRRRLQIYTVMNWWLPTQLWHYAVQTAAAVRTVVRRRLLRFVTRGNCGGADTDRWGWFRNFTNLCRSTLWMMYVCTQDCFCHNLQNAPVRTCRLRFFLFLSCVAYTYTAYVYILFLMTCH